jgi:hypothetical protein
LVAVGLWTDISVRLLRLPNLEQVTTVKLGGGRTTGQTILLQLQKFMCE